MIDRSVKVQNISDETLMAFVDGELSAADQDAVRNAIAADPALQSRMTVFVGNGRQLGQAFASVMDGAIPPCLRDDATARVSATVVPMPQRRSATELPPPATQLPKSRQRAAMAMAAAVTGVLFAGGIAAVWLQQNSTSSGSEPQLAVLTDDAGQAQTELRAALEAAASNTHTSLATLGGDVDVMAKYSFRSNDGAFCRYYEIYARASRYAAGLACRQDNGGWHVEQQTRVAAKSAAQDKVAPAGAEGSAEIEAAIDRMIAGDAIGRDEERDLIARGWK
ncbi:MAG: anti-sigma factor family protein [Hyphomicrobium sp.]